MIEIYDVVVGVKTSLSNIHTYINISNTKSTPVKIDGNKNKLKCILIFFYIFVGWLNDDEAH